MHDDIMVAEGLSTFPSSPPKLPWVDLQEIADERSLDREVPKASLEAAGSGTAKVKVLIMSKRRREKQKSPRQNRKYAMPASKKQRNYIAYLLKHYDLEKRLDDLLDITGATDALTSKQADYVIKGLLREVDWLQNKDQAMRRQVKEKPAGYVVKVSDEVLERRRKLKEHLRGVERPKTFLEL